MAFIFDLAEFLQTNGIGTQATNLFIGGLPASPDNCVSIDQSGGLEAERELPIEQPTVQVFVRNSDYTTGLAKIKAIYDLLHQANDTVVLKGGGVDLMTAFAMQEPYHMGVDGNARHLFVCNFVFKLRG